MIKKIFKFFAILLLVIIAAAIAIPYFFKDKIVAIVKEDINNSLNAKVDFTDVDLTLISSFPDFNFSMDQFSITGIDEFEGYSLVKANSIDLSLDLMSVINGDQIEINSIQLNEPKINIKVLRNGKANYDIAKPGDAVETTSEPLNFLANLQEYAISDGAFVYDDRQGGTYVEILDLDHSGQGAFTQDVFDLETKTEIQSLTTRSGGVAYLSKAKTKMDVTINADIPNSRYTIKDNKITVNALSLFVEGFVQMLDDKVKMDIKYNTPSNQFKHFLSMIPSAYTADFKDVQANGNLKFNGFVKGDYNLKTGALPAFQVNLDIANGDLKYPDLPLGIKGINTRTSIKSPSSNLDKMVIDVADFKMEIGNNPFQASMKLWSLMSDPNIDSKMNGRIDLEELSKAFPLEGVKKLNGIISANLNANTSMSSIDKGDYANVDMAGDLRIENMDYVAEDLPPVRINDMQMEFTPKNVKLDQFDAKLGRSDVQARGTIDNIMAFFAPEETMKGNVVVRSQLFDANEWIAETTDETQALAVDETIEEEYEVFDRFDFTVDGEIGKLYYDVYELKNSRLTGQVTPNKATINNFETRIGESDFKANGKINNIFNYVYENETMSGDINLVSNYINLNEFMVEAPSGEPQAKPISETVVDDLEAILVPEKMNFNIDADIKKILYTNIDLNNINGVVKVNNETVTMKNCKAKALGGNFIMNGTYNTQDPEVPAFDMDYTVKSLDFQKSFDKLNTFKALAPISKFINGQFNTTLKMKGALGKDMMPKLNSLSASGVFETINSTINNFEPLKKLGDKLNLKYFQSINLKNTINSFDVKDGKVTVAPFDFETKDVKMNISGSHSFESEMDYNLKANIPRSLLQKGAVGNSVEKGFGFLKNQASKLGINIDQGEFINIAAKITGTITNPKIKVELLGANGEAVNKDAIVNAVKEAVVDTLAGFIEDKTGIDIQKMNEEIANSKANLQAKLDKEIQGITASSDKLIADGKKAAENEVKKAKAEAQKLADKAKAEGYKKADELVKAAGNNPFKKKAAEIAAKKLKKETDKKAEQLVTKAEETAKSTLSLADKKGEDLKKSRDKKIEAKRAEYNKKAEEEEKKIRAKYEDE